MNHAACSDADTQPPHRAEPETAWPPLRCPQQNKADYCRVFSYLATSRNHGTRPTDAIHAALAGHALATFTDQRRRCRLMLQGS